jgi:hypothetical protein
MPEFRWQDQSEFREIIIFSKENGGLKFVISKPPLGYCILFWRADNQPPQQRFFLFPVGRMFYAMQS